MLIRSLALENLVVMELFLGENRALYVHDFDKNGDLTTAARRRFYDTRGYRYLTRSSRIV